MTSVYSRRRFVLTLAFLLACGGIAYADDGEDGGGGSGQVEGGGVYDDDHDQARQAVVDGTVLPLAEILARTKDKIDGEVVGIEFERRQGLYVYELKVITPSGQLREIAVDASSGEILSGSAD
jgi:uncharacterized membrane protein YkoI